MVIPMFNNKYLHPVFGYIVALIIILLGWELSSLLINSAALPSPYTSFKVFIEEFTNLAPHFLISSYRVILSILIGTLIAFPIALLCSRNNKIDAIFAPVLFLSYPIPKVVLLPVFLVLLGLGDSAKISLIALTVFFQVLMSLRDAVRQIPESYISSAKSFGANTIDVYKHVIIPAVMPDLFATLRVASGTGVALLFIAESIAGTTGLGYLIMNAWSLVNYPQMFASIIAMAALGVIVYEIIALFERKVCAWTQAGK